MSRPPDPFGTDAIAAAARELGNALEQHRRTGWAYGAYNQAFELLKAMEDRLSTRKNVPLKRFVVVPFYLWLRGFEQMAVSYGRWYAFAFVAALAGLFLAQLAPPDLQPAAETVTLLLNLFVSFSLVFAAPSTYCSAGTNAKHVHTITDKFFEWEIDSPTRIELILKNTRLFEDRVKRRLMIFRWLLGTGWAVYFSPLLAESLKDWHASRITLAELTNLFPPFAILIALFVMVEAYARGVDILFRCIELGCNERIADLDRDAKS